MNRAATEAPTAQTPATQPPTTQLATTQAANARAVGIRAPAFGLEHIHGNQDGPHGLSDTYTICRVGVPKARLLTEVDAGLHPNYEVVQGAKGSKYLRNSPNARGIDNIDSGAPWVCRAHHGPLRAEGPLGASLKARLVYPTRMTEFIHGEQPRGRAKTSYTLCRLGVPRQRVVEEIHAGMHPGYHVVVRSGLEIPEPRSSDNTWRCCMLSRATC